MKKLSEIIAVALANANPDGDLTEEQKTFFAREERNHLLKRMLDVRMPREQIEQSLADARASASTAESVNDRIRHDHEIHSLEQKLELLTQREEIEAERPDGCWCLGMGGRKVVARRIGPIRFSEYCDCPEGVAIRAEQDAEGEKAWQEHCQDNAQKFVDGLPSIFWGRTHKSFPTDTAEQRAALAAVLAWTNPDIDNDPEELQDLDGNRKPWVMFHGPYGCGKSHLAVETARLRLLGGLNRRATFVVVPDLLDRIRATFNHNRGEEREEDVMEGLRETELLILDDLGAERATDFVVERLFVLLNHRHEHQKRTIITSNKTPIELATHLGDERIAWRIAESAYVVPMTAAPNLRTKEWQLKLRQAMAARVVVAS